MLLSLEIRVRGVERELEEPARYTTRELLGIESRLAERALELAQEHTHDVSEELASAKSNGREIAIAVSIGAAGHGRQRSEKAGA